MAPQRHLTLPCPVLRQQYQREDGTFKQPSAASYSATAPPGSFNTLNRADETVHELYVVFNVVQEDGNVASKPDQMKDSAVSPSAGQFEDNTQFPPAVPLRVDDLQQVKTDGANTESSCR
ncbi:hypothetical protein PFLUV_G00276430 [Perca fluviatilis]|uniref:Uncharacterized protein n=1 Tax=Perca fluviatilis TaxID=8168 RepID=A0A6A5E7F6_PERFL|nr:hypothetical protein PFLUV_G00276430 [Perca fluviatilis]